MHDAQCALVAARWEASQNTSKGHMKKKIAKYVNRTLGKNHETPRLVVVEKKSQKFIDWSQEKKKNPKFATRLWENNHKNLQSETWEKNRDFRQSVAG